MELGFNGNVGAWEFFRAIDVALKGFFRDAVDDAEDAGCNGDLKDESSHKKFL